MSAEEGETTGITGSIRVNTAKDPFGIKVFKAPYSVAQWDQVDTAGLGSSWSPQQNSEIAWNSGALNQGLTSNPFDLGWGIYNQITHKPVHTKKKCRIMIHDARHSYLSPICRLLLQNRQTHITLYYCCGHDETAGIVTRA